MADIKEKQLHELLSHDMVDIYVGPDNTHWVLHEKLLCYRSAFFRRIFYGEKGKPSRDKTFGLPDEDDAPFKMFVGWLYSGAIRTPAEEKDLSPLFDLYLMGDKWQIKALVAETLEAVRAFYHRHETYPGLRRVQYIYANTEQESPMRHLLVDSVARYLTLSDGIPQHWDKALRKNGQLAVDIIKAVQEWHLESRSVPDARDASVERGRRQAEVKKDAGTEKAEVKKEGGKENGEGKTEGEQEKGKEQKETDGQEKPTMNGYHSEEDSSMPAMNGGSH